ncbi:MULTISPECIES: glycosyltransferase family 2 protein [Calothrix]|uniref:Glycosyltransferase family 2 protein n=2 Tax=Calothrix TaxID=1186 RepID=A0ABR8AE68_9CYAN|nr:MULTISPECIES: glycosyltransferase family 2 protein [Calothrix]MBD2197805.1 glycosyltransferase family 2 protein [Calothrix parietina FACHB-288]MBD2226209.1 glycosyltransferase family 2 protein [Calothrix anomala FACHB-343]
METSVSVVIPCYCCAKTIDRAVQSIAKQTLRPSEVILVNDGSQDDTWQILQKLQDEYEKNWIKVIDLKLNYGPSVARNIGWDLATQDYIAFLDADNAWHREKIAFQYIWMCNNPHVLVSGHAPNQSIIDTNLQEIVLLNQEVKASIVTKKQMLRSNPFETSSIMIKRNIEYRFDSKQKYCEDYFLWMQLSLDEQVIYLLDQSLTYVYKQPKSLSSNIFRMRLGDIHNFWKLWKSKRIKFAEMLLLMIKSLLKFMIFLISPKFHSHLKNIWLSYSN